MWQSVRVYFWKMQYSKLPGGRKHRFPENDQIGVFGLQPITEAVSARRFLLFHAVEIGDDWRESKVNRLTVGQHSNTVMVVN